MSKFICILFLICISLAVKIQVGSNVQLIQKIQLVCSGNRGKVAYIAETLPPGVRIVDSRLQIFDRKLVNPGVFPVRIRAVDQSGASDQKIIVVTIRNQGQQPQQVINKQNNANIRTGQTISISINGNSQNGFSNTGPLPVPILPKFSSTITPSASFPPYSGLTPPNFKEQPQNTPPNSNPQSSREANNILNQLQIPQNVPGFNPDANNLRNRIQQMPTNADPNLVNPTPNFIASNRARPTQANRLPITPNNIKFREAFNRQSTAGLGIANLLVIIQQSKTNRNAAIQEVSKRQQVLNQAKKKAVQTSSQSAKAQNQYNRILTGVKVITDNLNQLKKKQQQAQNISRQKPLERQSLISGISSVQAKIDNFNILISQKQKNYNDIKVQKQSKDNECNNLQRQLQNMSGDREKKISQMNNVMMKASIARRKIQSDKANVNDLKQKLAKAQAQLKQSQTAATQLQSQQKQLRSYFVNYESRLKDARARVVSCPAQSNLINQKLKAIQTQQLFKLRSQKDVVQKQLAVLNDQLAKLNNETTTLPKQIQIFKIQINQLQPRLNALRQQVNVLQRNFIQAKGIDTAANDQIKNAQLNLQAAQNKFRTQEANMQEANKNLALARAQKARADQAVQELIRQGADVQLFATPNPQFVNGSPISPNNNQNGNVPNNNFRQNTTPNSQNQNTNPNSSPPGMNFNINPNLNPKLFWDGTTNQPINNQRPDQIPNQPQNQGAQPDNPAFIQNNMANPNNFIKNNFINTNFPIRPNSNTNIPNSNVNDNYFSLQNQMRMANSNNNQQPINLPPVPKTPIVNPTPNPTPAPSTPVVPSTLDQTPFSQQLKSMYDQGVLGIIRPNRDGTYEIKSMAQYVLLQFTSQVRPPTDIKSTTLYPIKLAPPTDMEINSIPPTAILKSVSGYVIILQQKSLSLLGEDSNIYDIEYMPNIRAFTTQQNTRIEVGRKLLVRGYITRPLNMLAVSLLCVSQ